ncbi:MAG TPA: DUF882 domain-containing protein [Polyangiaceae bacterium]|nr:DUF882 domain-containing protein [Polyangiaceae bacterium]
MSSRALAAYFGALVALASPVPLAGEPAPPATSGGHSLRKGALVAHNALAGAAQAAAGAGEGARPAPLTAAALAEPATALAFARPAAALALDGPAAALSPGGPAEAAGARAAASDAEAATPGAEGPEGPVETLATLFNLHSNEALALDARGPSDERFARLLPDRTSGEVHRFDPRLLGVVRRVAGRHPGARIELVSGYRSPKFNEHLRKKGHRVASHSEHSRGHALDFRVEGLSPAEIVAEVRALGWKGGIGRYDGAGDRFVHVDVGRERFWTGR